MPTRCPGLASSEQPHRLRVHIPHSSDALNPGDRVGFKARLYPVPAQVVPGGRDFQRELYFAGIGAVGYTFGAARRIAGPEAAGGWREDLRQLRTEMARRIAAVLPGSTGGVASALITGKRGAISEEVKQAFRDSGLSHLLAIAGLHLGLVGAFVFFAVRGGLALVPPVALRYPIKKIAAGVTLVVLACYLLISGAAIPTERAFVMNGLVFGAIIIDRLRISMRVCAIAAAVVLVIDPDSPRRRQLSDVVRRGRRADRGLRDVWRAARPRSARPLGLGRGAGLLRRGRGDDGGRDIGNLSVLDLSFPPHRAVFAAGQRHRRAVIRDVDIALGGRRPAC